MKKQRRPAIGKKVVRGIHRVIPLIDVELEAGDCGGFQDHTKQSLEDIEAALNYFRALVDWHDGRATNE